jgi:hypothetical protein
MLCAILGWSGMAHCGTNGLPRGLKWNEMACGGDFSIVALSSYLTRLEALTYMSVASFVS